MRPPIRESAVERRLKEYAESLGCICFKFTSPGNTSVPDRLVCYQGRVLFLEIKAPGKKPTPKQDFTHRKMEKHGLLVRWVDNAMEGFDIIEMFVKNQLIP